MCCDAFYATGSVSITKGQTLAAERMKGGFTEVTHCHTTGRDDEAWLLVFIIHNVFNEDLKQSMRVGGETNDVGERFRCGWGDL